MKKMIKLLPCLTFTLGVVIGFGICSLITNKKEQVPTELIEVKQDKIFETYPNDFLVPLNRMKIYGGKWLADSYNPDGHYGSGEAPYVSMLFAIEDIKANKTYFFLSTNPHEQKIMSLNYLGEDIKLINPVYEAGNYGVKFLKKDVEGAIITSVINTYITGNEPDENDDSVKKIKLDQSIYSAEKFVDEPRDHSWLKEVITYEAFFARLKEAVKNDDRKTVANMMALPNEFRLHFGENVYEQTISTEAEFIKYYDHIITDKAKKRLEEETEIFDSWRGSMLGGFWIVNGPLIDRVIP